MPTKEACPSCGAAVEPNDLICANCELILDAQRIPDLPSNQDLSVVRRLLEVPQAGMPSARPSARVSSPSPAGRQDGPTRVFALGRSTGVPLVIASLTKQALGLSELEAFVTSFIDGATDVDGLAARAGLTGVEMGVVLQALRDKMIVDFADDGAQSAADTDDREDEAPTEQRRSTAPPTAAMRPIPLTQMAGDARGAPTMRLDPVALGVAPIPLTSPAAVQPDAGPRGAPTVRLDPSAFAEPSAPSPRSRPDARGSATVRLDPSELATPLQLQNVVAPPRPSAEPPTATHQRLAPPPAPAFPDAALLPEPRSSPKLASGGAPEPRSSPKLASGGAPEPRSSPKLASGAPEPRSLRSIAEPETLPHAATTLEPALARRPPPTEKVLPVPSPRRPPPPDTLAPPAPTPPPASPLPPAVDDTGLGFESTPTPPPRPPPPVATPPAAAAPRSTPPEAPMPMAAPSPGRPRRTLTGARGRAPAPVRRDTPPSASALPSIVVSDSLMMRASTLPDLTPKETRLPPSMSDAVPVGQRVTAPELDPVSGPNGTAKDLPSVQRPAETLLDDEDAPRPVKPRRRSRAEVAMAAVGREGTAADRQASSALQQALRFEQSGKLDEAVKQLESAIAQSPDAPSLYNRLAIILMRERADLERAERLLRQAIELAPTHEVYQRNLKAVLAKRAMKG